jgi:cell wall-associated NlpC family hydrolase
VDLAMTYQGTPYVWGGNSYEGVDCSGLVQQVFAAKGIKLPRLSADQARAGARVALNQLQPGDLVAWDNATRNRGADHIAIYIGNGQIVEAPRPGLNVRVRKLGDYDANAWGGRVITNAGE